MRLLMFDDDVSLHKKVTNHQVSPRCLVMLNTPEDVLYAQITTGVLYLGGGYCGYRTSSGAFNMAKHLVGSSFLWNVFF